MVSRSIRANDLGTRLACICSTRETVHTLYIRNQLSRTNKQIEENKSIATGPIYVHTRSQRST